MTNKIIVLGRTETKQGGARAPQTVQAALAELDDRTKYRAAAELGRVTGILSEQELGLINACILRANRPSFAPPKNKRGQR